MSDRLIFICYSEKDQKWKDQLQEQLDVVALEQDSLVFSRDNIGAGEDLFQKVEAALNKACVAILLVSAGSLNPKFLKKEEIGTILEQREQRGLRIFPIIVTPCPWDQVGWLQRIGVRPKDKKALQAKSAAKRAEELTKIVSEIAKIVDSKAGRGSQPGPAVQPEVPARVSKVDTQAAPPPETPRSVQDLKAEYEETKKKLSELHKQIELSSSQTSPTGAEAIPASFGVGEGTSPKTTAKPVAPES